MTTDTSVRPVEDFTTYVVMWNMPGCLPEMEPMVFNTFEDAKNALLEEFNNLRENTEDENVASDFHDMWHRLATLDRTPATWMSYAIDGYVYSITRDYER